MSAATIASVPNGVGTFTLLYIEDDVPTAEVFRSFLLNDQNRRVRLVVVADVNSAMSAVERSGAFSNIGRPDVIVLDLNLPCVNGFAVLEQIRATKDLQSTPVVIFSSSISECDRRQAEILGATEFISKPMDLDDFGAAVQHICSLLKA